MQARPINPVAPVNKSRFTVVPQIVPSWPAYRYETSGISVNPRALHYDIASMVLLLQQGKPLTDTP
jgi:hypothetical protein